MIKGSSLFINKEKLDLYNIILLSPYPKSKSTLHPVDNSGITN